MSKETKKTNWVAIVLVLILLAGCVFGVYNITNGFKENPFKKSGTDSSAGKELISTTIVSEKYGIFELTENTNLLNFSAIENDLLFKNGTNFNYLIEEYVDIYNSFNIAEQIAKEDIKVGYKADTSLSGKLALETMVTIDRELYAPLDNNIYKIYPDIKPNEIYPLSGLLVLIPSREYTDGFMSNVFIETYEDTIEELNFVVKYPILVVSDKGVPLTEKIYNEILEDPTTKITKNYKE